MAPRRTPFFSREERPEDDAARQREIAALLVPRTVAVQDVPIARIVPNPYQARREFPALDELAESIKSLGFVTRLRVRPDPQQAGMFQLVYGERRLRAAQQAGLTSVPCEIAEHSDAELLEIGLAENIQRRDLNPLEEAAAFRAMCDDWGYSIRGLAERLGKDKSYIESRLALLRAPDDVQEMVQQRPDTIRAAREIARLDDAAQRQPLIEGVLAGDLSKEEVREQVRTAAPTARLQRRLASDYQVLAAVLARWQGYAADAQQRALVREYAARLLDDVAQWAEAIEELDAQGDGQQDRADEA